MSTRHPLVNIPHKRWPQEVHRILQRVLYGRNKVPKETRDLIVDTFREMLRMGATLEEENYLEIERSLERSINGLVGAPFYVVASDGSGQFTSIKSAIDALPTNASANDISGVIYVKWSASTYDDGASTVDIGTKQVVLIGESQVPSMGLTTVTGTLTSPKWTSGGFTGASTGYIYVEGMNFNATNASVSGFVRVWARNCFFGSWTNQASMNNCSFDRCRFSTAVINTTACTVNALFFKNCDLAAGWMIASGTTTVANAGLLSFRDCKITNQVSTTIAGQNGAGSTQFEFIGNQIDTNANVTWTFNNSSNEDHYLIANNARVTNNTAILTISMTGSGHGPHVVLSGNDMPYTKLTFSYSASDAEVFVSGIYTAISSSSKGMVVQAILTPLGQSSITLLTLTSGAVGGNYQLAAINAGTTITGYSLASGANNNIITFTNLSVLSAVGTDSGSGNNINSLPPGGSAGGDLTGTYPSPTFDLTKTHIWTAEQKAPDWATSGLTGATTASRWVGSTASGAPGSGTFVTGDWIIDRTPTIYLCTAGGTPGTWAQIGATLSGSAGGDLAGTYPNPTLSPAADRSWNSHKITSLADATAATDAMNRQSSDARYVLLTTIPSETVYGTAGGTFTKASFPGLKAVRVRCVGSGGGSGGTAATAGGEAAASGGGGGGGYAEVIVAATSLGASETITVGAGGTAGTTGNNAGGNGNTTSFGTWAIAAGGNGGAGGANTSGNTFSSGGTGGSASAGDIQANGSGGGAGRIIGAVDVGANIGGGSMLGGGTLGTVNAGVGAAGKAYGGGAGGSHSGPSTGTRAGAAGADGVCIVELLY